MSSTSSVRARETLFWCFYCFTFQLFPEDLEKPRNLKSFFSIFSINFCIANPNSLDFYGMQQLDCCYVTACTILPQRHYSYVFRQTISYYNNITYYHDIECHYCKWAGRTTTDSYCTMEIQFGRTKIKPIWSFSDNLRELFK